MWLEFSRCSRCPEVGRLLRSDSSPESRGGRPNSSRNALPMLPSGSAIERWPSGRNVNGSGIGLEYSSVVSETCSAWFWIWPSPPAAEDPERARQYKDDYAEDDHQHVA